MKIRVMIAFLLFAWLCIENTAAQSIRVSEQTGEITEQNGYKRALYCERSSLGNLASIGCPIFKALRVRFAMYGRTNGRDCKFGNTQIRNCNQFYGFYSVQVKSVCDGRNKCTFNFPDADMPDPCPGFSKYFEIAYNCQKCPLGTWGEQCEFKCFCARGHCNSTSGACPPGGCKSGVQGGRCNLVCPDGSYGVNCNEKCNCNGRTCHAVSGICPARDCLPGWKGPRCNIACDRGTFGRNCVEYCSTRCAQCDRFTGCQACVAGKTNPPECDTDCPSGTYGLGCQDCGFCRRREPCDRVNGHCPDGCGAGYAGDLCRLGCADGWFGEGCKYECGNCKNDTTCDKITGGCPGGCASGFVGKACRIGTQEFIRYVVGTCLMVSGEIVIGFLKFLCDLVTFNKHYKRNYCKKVLSPEEIRQKKKREQV